MDKMVSIVLMFHPAENGGRLARLSCGPLFDTSNHYIGIRSMSLVSGSLLDLAQHASGEKRTCIVFLDGSFTSGLLLTIP